MYVGTSSPYNFNGLVRHYSAAGANVADLSGEPCSEGERKAQSHEHREEGPPGDPGRGARYGANVKVSEVPPGPPVLQTLVAEVYGPDYRGRSRVRAGSRRSCRRPRGWSDVDWYVGTISPGTLRGRSGQRRR